MIFYLNKDLKSGLYSVYEFNGDHKKGLIKVKNPIFSCKDDFIKELNALGYNKSYEVQECFFNEYNELIDIKDFD